MTGSGIPLTTRLAHEIPRPKDWQAFQRGCVLLFREELQDPTAQEYGRNGQDQGGIDILGRRNGDSDRYVGVQCRHIVKPDNEKKIISDCRAALQLPVRLREIIFATTAPDDTKATNTALRVEKTLRDEGHDLSVIIFGWGTLQNLIATCEMAYCAFCPSLVAPPSRLPWASSQTDSTGFAAQVAKHLSLLGIHGPPREAADVGTSAEDPALHARIDTLRDLFKEHRLTRPAETAFLGLLEKEELKDKPWARFRIETNLASIDLDLGRLAEGAARFEAAYAMRPTDPKAMANLSLARSIQGRYSEAMDLARAAMKAHPPCEYAITMLMQAAARSGWDGDPSDLIPQDLAGTAASGLGMSEFLRVRDTPDWPVRTLELAQLHPDVPEFRAVRGLATLALLVSSGLIVPGSRGPLDAASIDQAASDLKANAEHCITVGFADSHDLVAHLNNAGMLLRLAGRQLECETLLRQAVEMAPAEPILKRQLALAQVALGRRASALSTLAGEADPENQLLAAELTAVDDPRGALDKAVRVDTTDMPPALSRLRARVTGQLAIRVRDGSLLRQAVTEIRTVDPYDITADLLEIEWDSKVEGATEEVKQRLRAVAAALPHNAGAAERFMLAGELRSHDLPEEAASMLERHVDVDQRGPATTLYLQCLAEARRDEAFLRAVAVIGPKTEDADLLWTMTTHAWNVGDLGAADAAVDRLLRIAPDSAQARLVKIEVLIRQNRTGDLLAELDKPVEVLMPLRLQDRFRLVSLLSRFGYVERGAALAYRLYLENRDDSQAWTTLTTLVVMQGRGGATAPGAWNATAVAKDIAVDLRYDDGETLLLVVEPDPSLRRLDEESWEPEHPLVRALSGLTPGAQFTDPTGRKGSITQLRHKYVARLHYVLENHQNRFPQIRGFRKLHIDSQRVDGLDALIEQLKARSDWFADEQEAYGNGNSPLGVLAFRLGLDTIEAAESLAAAGRTLKVATGEEPERQSAAVAIRGNRRRGCVLDLLAFWTAWNLRALDDVAATCGRVHLPQSVVDRLRVRRDQMVSSAAGGLRSASYHEGRILLQDASSETVGEWLDDVDRALSWIDDNATVLPILATDELPVTLRDHLRLGQSDILDGVVLAMQCELLFVTDDGPTRSLGRSAGFVASAWLYQVFLVALEQGVVGLDTAARWSAALIQAGHHFIGISGVVMARAAFMDATEGRAPGQLYEAVTRMIGGRSAEPRSHISAVLGCLRELWASADAASFREPATGALLERLIREREDHGVILRTLLANVRGLPGLEGYIRAWIRGHFLAI